MNKEENEKLNEEESNPDSEVIRNRIGEIMSRILSNKYRDDYGVNVKIKFVPEDEKKDKE